MIREKGFCVLCFFNDRKIILSRSVGAEDEQIVLFLDDVLRLSCVWVNFKVVWLLWYGKLQKFYDKIEILFLILKFIYLKFKNYKIKKSRFKKFQIKKNQI